MTPNSKLRTFLDTTLIHSSWISCNIAVTKRRQDSLLGKMHTTRVRLCISRLIRSNPLVVRILHQWERRKAKKVNPSSMFSSGQVVKSGAMFSQAYTAAFTNSRADSISGVLKISLIIWATGFFKFLSFTSWVHYRVLLFFLRLSILEIENPEPFLQKIFYTTYYLIIIWVEQISLLYNVWIIHVVCCPHNDGFPNPYLLIIYTKHSNFRSL